MRFAFGQSFRRLLLPGLGTIITLVLAVPAAFSLHESFDLMFNIATGRELLLHGFPVTDPFSLTASNPWFPHEWGYSILSALSVQAIGGSGPAVLIALILATQCLLLWRLLNRTGNYSALTGLFMVLAIWGEDFAWNTERAYHLGHLMFTIGLYLVLLDHQGKTFAKWMFVPLIALWANLHGSWVVGPALLGSYSVGLILDNRKLEHGDLVRILVAFLSFLAAAISPEGVGTCLYPLRFLGGVYDQEIAEWHPLVLSNGCAKAVVVLMILSVFVLWRSSKKNLAFFLPVLGLSFVTIAIERFSPFSSMAMALYLAASWRCNHVESTESNNFIKPLSASLTRIARAWRTYNLNSGGEVVVVLVLITIVIGFALKPEKLVDRLDPSLFPVTALKQLRNNPPGRVFNTFRMGGAISAIDGPQYKVFIDGRSDPFSRKIHENYKIVALVLPGWKEIFDSYDPDYLLWSTVSYGSKLLKVLKSTGQWKVLVNEPIGVLWKKKRRNSKQPGLGQDSGK